LPSSQTGTSVGGFYIGNGAGTLAAHPVLAAVAAVAAGAIGLGLL